MGLEQKGGQPSNDVELTYPEDDLRAPINMDQPQGPGQELIAESMIDRVAVNR